MNDETIMAEENGRLRAENENLKAQVEKLADDHTNARANLAHATYGIGVVWIIALIITALFAIIVYPAWKSITTPHVVDHCYLDVNNYCDDNQRNCVQKLTLKGNVEWGNDDHIGTFDTIDQAVAAADKMHCPLLKGTP